MEQRREARGLSLSFSSIAGQPDTDVLTRRGAVQAGDLGGALEVASDAGSLQMDRIGGPVTARTGGGEIRVGSVEGDARCFTGRE